MQGAAGFPIIIDIDLKYARDNMAVGNFMLYNGKLCMINFIQDVRWLNAQAIRVRVTLLPMPDDFTAAWLRRQTGALIEPPELFGEG